MPARTITPHSRIQQGSNTATTGGNITLTVAAPAGALNFRDQYASGAVDVPLYLEDGTGSYEYSYGTLTYGATPVLDIISSRVITYSSSGAATPIAWGAGTRNAYCLTAPESLLHRENAGSELSDPQALAFALRLGITLGTSAGNVAVLDSDARYAASLLSPLRTAPSTITGGSNSKVVRLTSATAVTNAAYTDTSAQLAHVLVKGSDGLIYLRGSFGVPFTGVTFGTEYYLSTSGDLTSTPPTVDAGTGIKLVSIGMGVDTGKLYFDPRLLIVPDNGFAPSPLDLLYKAGYMQV